MSALRGDISTNDLVKTTGLSRFTLFRWVSLGLLVGPVVKPVPGGRGSRGMWPSTTVDDIVKIQELQADGNSLDAIRDQLDLEDDEATEVIDAQAADFVNGAGPAFVDAFQSGIRELCGPLVGSNAASRMAQQASVAPNVQRAIRYMLWRWTPVLVSDGRSVGIVPDFAVAKLQADQALPALLVVRLRVLLEDLLRKLKHGRLVSSNSTAPAAVAWTAYSHDSANVVETRFTIVSGPDRADPLDVDVRTESEGMATVSPTIARVASQAKPARRGRKR